jgi:hypothetical protein
MTSSYTVTHKGWVLLCPVYLAGNPEKVRSVIAIPRLSFVTFWFTWNIAVAEALAELVWAFATGPDTLDFWGVTELAKPFEAVITVD